MPQLDLRRLAQRGDITAWGELEVGGAQPVSNGEGILRGTGGPTNSEALTGTAAAPEAKQPSTALLARLVRDGGEMWQERQATDSSNP